MSFRFIPKASVANIRDLPSGWKSDPRYIYIGRAGHGETGYFGNPIRLIYDTPAERERVLDDYRIHFRARWRTDVDFRTAIAKMPRDAVLVCFCAPKRCHGEVIVEVINHIHADDFVPMHELAAEREP